MKAKNNEKLILSLIKDDLINAKLVNGLNKMGLDADNYLLHLSHTIFKLMGFQDNAETEIVFTRYMKLTERAVFVNISQSHKPMDELALRIYTEILARKA